MPPLRPVFARFSTLLRPAKSKSPFHVQRRTFSSPTPPPAAAAQTRVQIQPSRVDRIISRLPRPLREHAARLRIAPVSHAVAFLVLHEITAVVPLLGLFGLFRWGGERWMPTGWVAERWGPYVQDGMLRFEKYFRRKGWLGLGREGASASGRGASEAGQTSEDAGKTLQIWQRGEGGYRVVAEVALAYAITKALLPVRILVSLWATPWFARGLVRARSLLYRGKR